MSTEQFSDLFEKLPEKPVAKVVAVHGEDPYVQSPQAQYNARQRAKMVVDFNAWLTKISELPVETLTEDQWISACKAFEGCALCNNTEIDSRGMFIRFQDGGKYCVWNVIPVCEQCATAVKFNHNPFYTFNEVFNNNLAVTRGLGRKKLAKVIEYLDRRIAECQALSIQDESKSSDPSLED